MRGFQVWKVREGERENSEGQLPQRGFETKQTGLPRTHCRGWMLWKVTEERRFCLYNTSLWGWEPDTWAISESEFSVEGFVYIKFFSASSQRRIERESFQHNHFRNIAVSTVVTWNETLLWTFFLSVMNLFCKFPAAKSHDFESIFCGQLSAWRHTIWFSISIPHCCFSWLPLSLGTKLLF